MPEELEPNLESTPEVPEVPKETLVKKPLTPKAKFSNQVYWIAGTVVVIVLLLSILGWQIHKQLNTPVPTPVATETAALASPSPTPSVSPSPSASPTVSPSPSPSPTLAPSPSALPDSVNTFVASFYSDYKAKNATALATFFTPDTDATDLQTHDTLFTGVDQNGNPGGPTLFSSNSASESVASYSIQSEQAQGSGWILTINENRLSSTGSSSGTETTIMVLTPSGSTWLINSYYHQGAAASKYDGFLIPS